MLVFITATPSDTALAIHQTLAEARMFASEWQDLSGEGRDAACIYSADRDQGRVIYARSNRINRKHVVERFDI